ncbi:MAG TPA: glycosyltransferase family A protein [Bacteroidales bacterium]|nr:glycosyltransferase family A protein [Bacteroidales bacterium]
MIKWYTGNKDHSDCRFSILIPSWNNLEYLKICVNSILKNSSFRHQIIIHVNEGSDGTLEWVRASGFDYTYSQENSGVCWAMNAGRSLVCTDYLVFVNDDMYMLPGWDTELWKEIEKLPDIYFFLSSSTIEPRKSPYLQVLAENDYGTNPENFKEQDLLDNFRKIEGIDWSGSTWPPNIVHRNIWDLVGGYSIEYFPGLYSDPDFSMKLFEAGVRYFKGVDASRAYHFGSKSTTRSRMNNGSKQFLSKWGITSESFTRIFLRRGKQYNGRVKVERNDGAFRRALLKSRLKRFFWLITGTGKAIGRHSFNSFK